MTRWGAIAAIVSMLLALGLWTLLSGSWLLLLLLLITLATVIGAGSWATSRAQTHLMEHRRDAEFVARADLSPRGLAGMVRTVGDIGKRVETSERLDLAGYIVLDAGGVTWLPGVLARRRATAACLSWSAIRHAKVQQFGLRTGHGAILSLFTDVGPITFRTFRAPDLAQVLESHLGPHVDKASAR